MASAIPDSVSVVIPTFGRSKLLRRAVESVLKQTKVAHEIIVVVDGKDAETYQELISIGSSRIIIKELATKVGASAARNVGIAIASSYWVALLDDDDEWLPSKLEAQLSQAKQDEHFDKKVFFTTIIAEAIGGSRIWPRRKPIKNESVGEYLFCQRSFLGGDGFISLSSILIARKVACSVSFREDLPRLQDVDWFLSLEQQGIAFKLIDDPLPLVIMYISHDSSRISNSIDWQYCLNWAIEHKEILGDKALVSFILTEVARTACRSSSYLDAIKLLFLILRFRHPRLADLFAYLSIILIPEKLRWYISAKYLSLVS